MTDLQPEEIKFLNCFALIGDDFIAADEIFLFFQAVSKEEKIALRRILDNLTAKNILVRDKDFFKINEQYYDKLQDAENQEDCTSIIFAFLNIFQPPFEKVRPFYEMLLLKFFAKNTLKNDYVALLYNHYARYLLNKKDYDEALRYNSLAIDLQLEINPLHEQIAKFYNTAALIYYYAKNYQKAIDTAFSTVKKIESLHFAKHKELFTTYKILSESFFHLQDLEKAEIFANKALEYADKPSLEQISVYQLLLLIFLKKKDFQKALQISKKIKNAYFKLPENQKDTKTKNYFEQQISYIQKMLHLDERRKKLTKLLGSKIWLLVIIIAIVILVGVLIFNNLL